jgi:hypothetical protein
MQYTKDQSFSKETGGGVCQKKNNANKREMTTACCVV